MENATSSRKLRIMNENVSPLRIPMTTMSPGFQPYAENINVGSPLARFVFSGSPISGRFSLDAGEAFTPPAFGASKYRSAAKAQHYYSNSSGNSSFGSRGRPSPLSSIENLDLARRMSPPMYGTPVKAEEEVLVMDDIRVKPMSGSKSGRSSSSSSGRASSSSWSPNIVIKTEICRAWEETGNCRYNSICQFAHGKEELHPGASSMMPKSKAQKGKSTSRAGSAGSCTHSPKKCNAHQQHYAAAEYELGPAGSCTHSPKKRNAHQQHYAAAEYELGSAGSCTYSPKKRNAHPQHYAAAEYERNVLQQDYAAAEHKRGSAGSCTYSPKKCSVHQHYAATEHERGVTRSQPASPEPRHHTLAASSSNTSKFNDWSPLDDGIEVLLPGSDKAPSREELDAQISGLLSGLSLTTKRRRLPVFEALCSG